MTSPNSAEESPWTNSATFTMTIYLTLWKGSSSIWTLIRILLWQVTAPNQLYISRIAIWTQTAVPLRRVCGPMDQHHFIIYLSLYEQATYKLVAVEQTLRSLKFLATHSRYKSDICWQSWILYNFSNVKLWILWFGRELEELLLLSLEAEASLRDRDLRTELAALESSVVEEVAAV